MFGRYERAVSVEFEVTLLDLILELLLGRQAIAVGIQIVYAQVVVA